MRRVCNALWAVKLWTINLRLSADYQTTSRLERESWQNSHVSVEEAESRHSGFTGRVKVGQWFG